jgi:protein SCO1
MIFRPYTRLLILGTSLAASLGGVIHYVRLNAGDPANREGSCCSPKDLPEQSPSPPLPSAAAREEPSRPLSIPDTPVIDQHGRPLRFYSDLVKGQVVAVNFIFTTCKGVCPPMGATFGKLAKIANLRGVRLISVSVDPLVDTPPRLAAWAEPFGSSPNWTLVTGKKQDVDGLLRALGSFSADKTNHSQLILLGNESTGTWRRINGLSPIPTIQSALDSLREPDETSETALESAARRYFTDITLVNQNGESMRLYSDLLRGKVVVIHVFFASCKNTCPLMMATYQKLQEHLGERLGREVHLLSITVDPDNDRWEVMKDYAGRVKARPGWYLLSGPRTDVEIALGKLGLSTARPEGHSNVFLIGNEPTRLWKKVQGLAPAYQIIEILDGVLADPGEKSGREPMPPSSRGD